jgi:hypothetical protein
MLCLRFLARLAQNFLPQIIITNCERVLMRRLIERAHLAARRATHLPKPYFGKNPLLAAYIWPKSAFPKKT